MYTFNCKNRKETWDGAVTMLKNQGDHYEFHIQSRPSIMVIFGKTSIGYFACMPDFNVGCHLASLNDVSWNTERLTKVLGKVDGVTVANAIASLANDLKYPEF